MFKRMIFAELLVAASVLPAFSAGFDSNATGEIQNACVADYLGVSSGNTVLQAKWKPKVYYFVLDDNIYGGKSDNVGSEPTLPLADEEEELYTRYEGEGGMYTDSSAAVTGNESDRITTISVPEKTGYRFNGFYTEKHSGGTQVISADGQILPAMQSFVSNSTDTPTMLYAHWVAVEQVNCKAGYYLPAHTGTAADCTICPENHYCVGGTFDAYASADQGIDPCTNAGTGGYKSPMGSTMANDCGVILHVDGAKLYLHADKATTPSFVTEVNGKKWYGNMTLVTNTCEKTMSPDTTKTMHVDRDTGEYTVHGRYVKSAGCGDTD